MKAKLELLKTTLILRKIKRQSDLRLGKPVLVFGRKLRIRTES